MFGRVVLAGPPMDSVEIGQHLGHPYPALSSTLDWTYFLSLAIEMRNVIYCTKGAEDLQIIKCVNIDFSYPIKVSKICFSHDGQLE